MREYITGDTCTHCGGPQIGSAGVYLDGVEYPLCHPNAGLDCYRKVTVYHHPPANCPDCTKLRSNDATSSEEPDLRDL